MVNESFNVAIQIAEVLDDAKADDGITHVGMVYQPAQESAAIGRFTVETTSGVYYVNVVPA